jgi:hypothetical protein
VVGRLTAYDDLEGHYHEASAFQVTNREDLQRLDVSYNPYKGPSFFDKATMEPVGDADVVFMGNRIVVAYR